ncbi:hypothetical protein [Piscinibacter koreensis]|nr:hypothetical protein [Schlegelella koreensis]
MLLPLGFGLPALDVLAACAALATRRSWTALPPLSDAEEGPAP